MDSGITAKRFQERFCWGGSCTGHGPPGAEEGGVEGGARITVSFWVVQQGRRWDRPCSSKEEQIWAERSGGHMTTSVKAEGAAPD